MSREDDEDEKLFFQMDRFVNQNGQWYYTTREGEERGPFENREEAEQDLEVYMAYVKHADE